MLANWVKVAWESLDSDSIKGSFKCCGIPVKNDESENNYDCDSPLE